MIPHSSLKKLFIYLTGLIITCFLHFSCQSLSSPMYKPVPSSTQSSNTLLSKSSIDIPSNLDVGMSSKPKDNKNKILYSETLDKEKNICGKWEVAGNDSSGFSFNPILKELNANVNDGTGDHKPSKPEEQTSAKLTKYILSSNAKGSKGKLCDAHDQMTSNDSWHEPYCAGIIVNINLSSHELEYSNRGDCRMTVHKENGELVYITKEKMNGFNYPCTITPTWQDGPPEEEDYCNTEKYTIKIDEDKTIVLSSDGFHDNTSTEEIVAITKNGGSAQEIAEKLVNVAYNNSIKEHLDKPSNFEYKHIESILNGDSDAQCEQARLEIQNGKLSLEDLEAIFAGKKKFIGKGKQDDISVVVIKFRKQNN